jgi:phenylpyruvate tautomerase PptA (4-oxalocrotonate tautomerase family)
MPTILIKTNINLDEKSKRQILVSLSDAVSRIVGKPHCDIMILFSREDIMMGGTLEPAAFVEIRHVSPLGMAGMKELCEELGKLLAAGAQIGLNRIYVQFSKVGDAFAWRFMEGAATCPRMKTIREADGSDRDEPDAMEIV